MSNNQKEKLLSQEEIKKFIEEEDEVLLDKNDKFIEFSSSLAYYLKSFTNIKRFLEYISLILKHTFKQQLNLIIPFNKKGEIWKENILFSGSTDNLKRDHEIESYVNNFDFSYLTYLKINK